MNRILVLFLIGVLIGIGTMTLDIIEPSSKSKRMMSPPARNTGALRMVPADGEAPTAIVIYTGTGRDFTMTTPSASNTGITPTVTIPTTNILTIVGSVEIYPDGSVKILHPDGMDAAAIQFWKTVNEAFPKFLEMPQKECGK